MEQPQGVNASIIGCNTSNYMHTLNFLHQILSTAPHHRALADFFKHIEGRVEQNILYPLPSQLGMIQNSTCKLIKCVTKTLSTTKC